MQIALRGAEVGLGVFDVLSILYLRCQPQARLIVETKGPSTFNSLSEMR